MRWIRPLEILLLLILHPNDTSFAANHMTFLCAAMGKHIDADQFSDDFQYVTKMFFKVVLVLLAWRHISKAIKRLLIPFDFYKTLGGSIFQDVGDKQSGHSTKVANKIYGLTDEDVWYGGVTNFNDFCKFSVMYHDCLGVGTALTPPAPLEDIREAAQLVREAVPELSHTSATSLAGAMERTTTQSLATAFNRQNVVLLHNMENATYNMAALVLNGLPSMLSAASSGSTLTGFPTKALPLEDLRHRLFHDNRPGRGLLPVFGLSPFPRQLPQWFTEKRWDLLDCLRRAYNDPKMNFKSPQQKQLLDVVLNLKGDCIIVLPTGGGKSAVYEVPARILADIAQESGKTPMLIIVLVPFLTLAAEGLQKNNNYAYHWTSIKDNRMTTKSTIVYVCADKVQKEAFME